VKYALCVRDSPAFAWLRMMERPGMEYPKELEEGVNTGDQHVELDRLSDLTWSWRAVDMYASNVIVSVFYIPPNQESIPRAAFHETTSMMRKRKNKVQTSPGELIREQDWDTVLSQS
jgi:hypothetical protein